MSHLDRRQMLKLGLTSAGAGLAANLGGSSLLSAAQGAQPSGILVGTSRVDITPSLPTLVDIGEVEMADVIRPLYARIVYLESGGQKIMLIATDSTSILRTAYSAMREAIAAKTGLAPNQIIINSSHTHRGLYYAMYDKETLAGMPIRMFDMEGYRALLTNLADGAAQAIAGRRPATLSVGVGQLTELAWNRRLAYLSEYHEEIFNARRKFPIGTTDPSLGVVKAETADGTPLAILCFYACHPTVAEPGVSGDYPGFATAELERLMGPSCTALFFQGCGGNIAPNPHLFGSTLGTKAGVNLAGTLFTARVLQTLATSMHKIDSSSFIVGRADYDLPLIPLSYGLTAVGEGVKVAQWFAPPPLVAEHKQGSIQDLERRFKKFAAAFDLKNFSNPDNGQIDFWMIAIADRLAVARNLAEWRRHEVHALICGPLCLAFLPGEAFVDYGLEIKQNSPFKYTFVSAYNDVTIQYVPDPIAFEEGGYETGPWCYSTPETGGVLVSESLKLIKSLQQSSLNS